MADGGARDEDVRSGGSGVRSGGLGQANFALGVFLAAYVLSFIDRQILSLMVEPIRRDLGISDFQMGLLQGLAFALLYSVVGVPIGLLADRASRRHIIAGGVLFWSMCTALCGFAGSFTQLFVTRMGVGVGEATLSPAAHSSMSDAFPAARLARAMAIYTLGITVGSGAAMMIGGTVVDALARSGDVRLPLAGHVHAWQAAFLIVSLPGVLVAALVMATREPQRRHRSGAGSGGFARLLGHLAAERRAFLGIYGNSTMLAILGYGLPAWYPTLLIRHFGLTAGEAAARLGLAYLIAGSAGAIAGGMLAERLARHEVANANLRVALIVAVGAIIPATLAPLMPSPFLVMLCFIPLCFIHNGYFGCSTAAIQLATPGEMRATHAALFLLANSLLGLSVGTALPPLIDRWLFGGHGALGPSLALVGIVTSVAAAGFGLLGLRRYGAIVRALQPAT